MTGYLIRSLAVFTGLQDVPEPAALLIRDNRIEKVLPYAYNQALYGSLPLYDYGGRLVMSSFLDAHTHILSGAVAGSAYVCSSLGACVSQKECVEQIAAFAREHPEYKRIRGTGWFVGNWKDAPLPDKRSLDKVLPDIPVYLQCADAHSMWLNSAALLEAGIRPRPDLKNGIVGTFENGELSGLLLEPAACEPAMAKYMEFTEEEQLEIHRAFQRELAKNGIGAVSEMFADDYTQKTIQSYDMLQRLDKKQEICSHIFFYTKLFGYTDFTKFRELERRYNQEGSHLHIAGVKGFVDGVTETYTGLLLEPYEDRPKTCGDGLPLWPRERMQAEITAANKAGIQVRLHCIADGSVRMALDMYEQAQQALPGKELRNTIEHIENIHPADIERFAKLQVIPSMQPAHLILSKGEKILRLGKERCRYEWPMRSVYEKTGRMAIGTDYPVVKLNPFENIYAAVTRKDEAGRAVGQNPWETMGLADVLKGYTRDSAYVYQCEKEMGTLEEGKLANLIVLDQNLFEIEEEQIPNTHVLVHFFEGKVIYNRS